jgi:hypothetical protein
VWLSLTPPTSSVALHYCSLRASTLAAVRTRQLQDCLDLGCVKLWRLILTHPVLINMIIACYQIDTVLIDFDPRCSMMTTVMAVASMLGRG